MAAGLHGSARTTPRVRAELQTSQETTRALAARYGLNPKDRRQMARANHDRRRADGTSRPRSTVLTETEEAIVVEFRRRTLLPLDDVLGCLRETIPKLTRRALHRCLERHGISRLPEGEEKASKRRRFAETKIGYVHIDVCELRLAQGKLFMFLAIDRVSKFAHVDFHDDTKSQRRRLPARGGRGLSLPNPHGADRQRHGLCRPAQEPGGISRQWRPHLRPGLQQTASGTGSPSPTTLGRTAKPSG